MNIIILIIIKKYLNNKTINYISSTIQLKINIYSVILLRTILYHVISLFLIALYYYNTLLLLPLSLLLIIPFCNSQYCSIVKNFFAKHICSAKRYLNMKELLTSTL